MPIFISLAKDYVYPWNQTTIIERPSTRRQLIPRKYTYRMPGYFAVCWELWRVYNLLFYGAVGVLEATRQGASGSAHVLDLLSKRACGSVPCSYTDNDGDNSNEGC